MRAKKSGCGPPDDVKRVASGLHVLRCFVKREIQGIRTKAGEDGSRVLADLVNAAALLDALKTGRDHPIWLFVRGMQKGNRRAKALPNRFNVWKRGAILAYVTVLKSEGQAKLRQVCRRSTDQKWRPADYRYHSRLAAQKRQIASRLRPEVYDASV